MISCLEFRRQVLVAPELLEAALQEHLQQCPECRQYYRGLLAQEQQLKAALAVEVPENLAAELRLQQRFSTSDQRSRSKRWVRRFWPLALAASLVVGSIWLPLPSAEQRLAREVLAHLQEDQAAWAVAKVSTPELDRVLQRVSLSLAPAAPTLDWGQLSFAGNCVIDGKLAAHLVVHTPSGPITLLLMPELSVGQELVWVDGGWQATLEPMEQGAMAVVAKPEVDLTPYRQQLRQQVKTLRL